MILVAQLILLGGMQLSQTTGASETGCADLQVLDRRLDQQLLNIDKGMTLDRFERDVAHRSFVFEASDTGGLDALFSIRARRERAVHTLR